MAADHAAQPSDNTQPDDERPERDIAGEEHDLSYLRTRRARANDPRRSLNAAFADRSDPPNLMALRRAAPAPAAATPEPASHSGFLGRSRGFWVLSAALFALVAGVTFAIFYFHQAWAARASVAPEIIRAPVPVSHSSLRMHVEVQGERVLVSWDPRASGVQQASGGLLTIEDAGQKSEFPLDATQAANGSVLYRPASGDVTFRLQIHDASGAVFNDSLRVLDPARRALLAQKNANPEPASTHARPQRAAVQLSAAPAKRSRSGRFVAPKIVPRVHAADSRVSMPGDAPAVLRPAQVVADSTLPAGIISNAAPPPLPSRRVRGETMGELIGTASAHRSDGSGDGLFLPPQPVQQVMPTIRSSLMNTITPGTKVEVLVRIDTRGRVKHAEIAPASKDIDIGVQKAAIDAAEQWRFAPAWQDGRKVDSEDTIVFEF